MNHFSLTPYDREIQLSFKAIEDLAAPSSDSTAMIVLTDTIEGRIATLEKPLDAKPWYIKLVDSVKIAVRNKTSRQARIEYITKQAQKQHQVCVDLRKDVQSIAELMSAAASTSVNYGQALEDQIRTLESAYASLSASLPGNEQEYQSLANDLQNSEEEAKLVALMGVDNARTCWDRGNEIYLGLETQLHQDKNDIELIELKLPLLKESYARAEIQVDTWKQKIRGYQRQMITIDLTLAEYQGLTQPQLVMLEGDRRIRELAKKVASLSNVMTKVNTEASALHGENLDIDQLTNDQMDRRLLDELNGDKK